MDAETLRRWMLAEGLWSRERKRRRHRQRRDRKEHFGEMVQMDGSFHAWLEERGPEGCLIDMVDDATNTTWAQLGEQETIWAAADALRAWIERYGVPLALYVDWKNLYKRPATPGERMRGEEPMTQFGRMCRKLGITLIAASSPQAKGRVEREHGTHQDRLVKKLRRKGIDSHEAENVICGAEYLAEHNGRFARVAARKEDYHRRAPRATELERIFRLETERTVSDDWVVRYDNRFFQLEPQSQSYAPTRSKVLVCEGRYGGLAIEYRGRPLRWREIVAPAKPQDLDTPVRKARPRMPISVKKRKWTPPANHPWHQAVRREVQKRASKLATTATGTAERAHRAGAEQSVGMRGAVRQDEHRALEGVRCAGGRLPRQYRRRVWRQQPARRDPRVPISVKKRKWTPPPSHPWHEPPRPKVQKRARRQRQLTAHDVGLALRFALNAPPCGLRRAALRTRPTDRKHRDAVGRARKGSSFLELPDARFFEKATRARKKRQQQKKGTFLTR